MRQTSSWVNGLITTSIVTLFFQGCGKTTPKETQTPVPMNYSIYDKPEALTWMQRAQKKQTAGKFDTARLYYDKALAVNVEDINYQIAIALWNADNGLPWDAAKVETIAESMPPPRQRALLSLMGRSYLKGSPDHIPKNIEKALTLLTKAKDMGDLDSRLMLNNYNTGRNVPLIGQSQFSEDSFEVDLSGTPKNKNDKSANGDK